MSIIETILNLLFGKATPTPKEEQKEKRPYVNAMGIKVGEVQVINPRFYGVKGLEYSITNGVPNFVFDCHAIETGNVTFRLYVDGDINALNNPPLQTASFTLGNPDKELRFQVPKDYSHKVGKHTMYVDQICLIGYREDGSRIYQTYSTYTFEFEVRE